MIKEGIETIANLARAAAANTATVCIDGDTYAPDGRGGLAKIAARPAIARLNVGSLGAIDSYLREQRELLGPEPIMVAIYPREVLVYGTATATTWLHRTCLIRASVEHGDWRFGGSIAPDQFVVWIQTHFAPTADRDVLLRTLSRIRAVSSITAADDGISQTVEVTRGKVTVEEKKIANPVYLVPRRSFPEVELEPVPYVIRLGMSGEEVRITLHEADGGVWRVDAVAKVKAWLTDRAEHWPTEPKIILLG